MREIIIVAPEQYQDLARKITHEISKQPGFRGVYWTIKQYADNEFLQVGNRYVLLLGNPDENRFTKDYLQVIKNMKNQSGACYGYDGSKAVIFGEGKLEHEKEFKKILKKCTDFKEEGTAGHKIGAVLAIGLVPFISRFLIAPSIIYYFVRSAKVKKLKKEQTATALTLFLAEFFDDWAGNKKTEQGA